MEESEEREEKEEREERKKRERRPKKEERSDKREERRRVPFSLRGPPSRSDPRSAHEGKDEGRTGEGPACSLLRGVCDPLSSLPAGSLGVPATPGDNAPFALNSLQDGFQTTSRRDEDEKTISRR